MTKYRFTKEKKVQQKQKDKENKMRWKHEESISEEILIKRQRF